MKRLCPCLDFYIDIKECEKCEDKCDNPLLLDSDDMIKSIYAFIYPNNCFVNYQQAYEDILKYLKTCKINFVL